jgi:hypothetical protein
MQSPASTGSDATDLPSPITSTIVLTMQRSFAISYYSNWQVFFYSQEISLSWIMCQSTISRSQQGWMHTFGTLMGFFFDSCPHAPQN